VLLQTYLEEEIETFVMISFAIMLVSPIKDGKKNKIYKIGFKTNNIYKNFKDKIYASMK